MAALQMMITDAGLAAIVDAQNGGTEEVLITSIGLTDTPFVMAPTIDNLPGEFRRIDTVSGQAVAENIIHVVAYDPAPITYDVTGFGLYDAGGTLIAIHSAAADPILSKAALATSLFAVDVVLASEIVDVIEFGDALFLNPPATEDVMGVLKLSTNDLADAGEDDETAMTPKKVKRVLDAAIVLVNGSIAVLAAVVEGISDALTALLARTFTGGGLATGGGDLTASRVITVTAATQAQTRAGTANDVALTPAALGPMTKSLGSSGYVTIPGADPANTVMIQWGQFTANSNGNTAVSFPTSFTGAAWSVVAGGTDDTSSDSQDNWPDVIRATITANGFSVFNANDSTDPCCFFAIGRIDLS